MYHKRSLRSYLYILWLLFGCSILNNHLYAKTKTNLPPETRLELLCAVFQLVWNHRPAVRYIVLGTGGFLLLTVYSVGAFSHKIYKNYFAKEKKVSTTPVAPASPRKNWLLFMLCLLLGVLLMVGIFYHQQKKRA